MLGLEFWFFGVVSLGILVISLGAASSLCSGTDSATTYTSGNYKTYWTGGKIQPPKPVNNSSHLFTEMWGEVAAFLELVTFLTVPGSSTQAYAVFIGSSETNKVCSILCYSSEEKFVLLFESLG